MTGNYRGYIRASPSSDAQLVSIRAIQRTLYTTYTQHIHTYSTQRIQPTMANTVKINLGSLGCLGGEGNLRDTSIHDSTCSCEGCLEEKFAAREFTIGADPFSKAKDVGCNKKEDDEDLIILDSDVESVSDIFDIHDDPPSTSDDGYCDDGNDDEDTYSVFSPTPCTIDDQAELVGGLDNIEEEDTPPTKVEDTINDASIEASKRDGTLVEECIELVENEGHESIQLRDLDTFLNNERVRAAAFWKSQIERYETKITNLFKTITRYTEGLRAAKRRMDYDAYEIRWLRELVMDKTTEANQKDERIYQVTNAMCLMEHGYQLRERRKQKAFNEMAKQLDEQLKVNDTLKEELKTTRERLNTFTRRSVPRRTKRLRRHIASYDDGDEESSVSLGSCSDTEYEDDDARTSKLVKIMNSNE